MAAAVRLAELALEFGRVDRDWAILAEGNCSMLSADGRVTVKASGVEMGRASPDGFVEVALAELLALIDDPKAGDAEVAATFDAIALRSGAAGPRSRRSCTGCAWTCRGFPSSGTRNRLR